MMLSCSPHGPPTRASVTTAIMALSCLLGTSACAAFSATERPRPPSVDCVVYDVSFREALVGNDRWAPPEFLGFSDGGKTSGEYAACPTTPPPPELAQSVESYVRIAARSEGPVPSNAYFTGFNGERPDPAARLAGVEPRAPEATGAQHGVLYRFRSYHAFFRGCVFKVLSTNALGATEQCQAPPAATPDKQ